MTTSRSAAIRRGLEGKFTFELKSIETAIRIIADRIDDLGELGEQLGDASKQGMGPDEIACYAANGLQGTLALLRDLRRATKLAAGKRGRK